MKPLALDADLFLRALRAVSVAMSRDATRPQLNCVCLEADGVGFVTLSATTGYWLARWSFGAEIGADAAFRLPILSEDVRRIRLLLRGAVPSDEVLIWPKRRLVRVGRTLLALKPYTCALQPPPYAKVIPKLAPEHQGISGLCIDARLLGRVATSLRRAGVAKAAVEVEFSGGPIDPILITSPHERALTYVVMPCGGAVADRVKRDGVARGAIGT